MSATGLIARKGVAVLIQRSTVTKDAALSPKKAWATIASVTAFIQPRSSAEGIRYGRESTRRFSKIYLPPGTEVRKGDRIKYGTRIFDTLGPVTPGEIGSGRVAHVAVEAEETDQ